MNLTARQIIDQDLESMAEQLEWNIYDTIVYSRAKGSDKLDCFIFKDDIDEDLLDYILQGIVKVIDAYNDRIGVDGVEVQAPEVQLHTLPKSVEYSQVVVLPVVSLVAPKCHRAGCRGQKQGQPRQ